MGPGETCLWGHLKKPVPIIVFGVMLIKKRSEAKDLGLIITDQGPPFVDKDKVGVWGLELPKGSNIEDIHFQARPLIAICDQKKAEYLLKTLTNKYNPKTPKVSK